MEGMGQMSGAGLLCWLTDVSKIIFIAVLAKIEFINALFGTSILCITSM